MKDYIRWHEIKRHLEGLNRRINFREREIWWCSLGENLGAEQDGKHERFERPILVFRKFNRDLFWDLPLTSTRKKSQFYFPIEIHGIPRSIILSQVKTMSAKRLTRRLAKIHPRMFDSVIQGFLRLINQTDLLWDPRVPIGNL